MKAYQIKVTQLTGRDAGHTYILTKGGYIAHHERPQSDYECYLTERTAKMVCTKYAKANERDNKDEAWIRDRREKEGAKNHELWIYPLCKYEPVEVECYEKEMER